MDVGKGPVVSPGLSRYDRSSEWGVDRTGAWGLISRSVLKPHTHQRGVHAR